MEGLTIRQGHEQDLDEVLLSGIGRVAESIVVMHVGKKVTGLSMRSR